MGLKPVTDRWNGPLSFGSTRYQSADALGRCDDLVRCTVGTCRYIQPQLSHVSVQLIHRVKEGIKPHKKRTWEHTSEALNKRVTAAEKRLASSHFALRISPTTHGLNPLLLRPQSILRSIKSQYAARLVDRTMLCSGLH